jgi:hypothetical protein
MLVNEACFSGAWTPIVAEAGSNRDVIVEAASRANERSASGKYRCSLFACAYVEEIETTTVFFSLDHPFFHIFGDCFCLDLLRLVSCHIIYKANPRGRF